MFTGSTGKCCFFFLLFRYPVYIFIVLLTFFNPSKIPFLLHNPNPKHTLDRTKLLDRFPGWSSFQVK